MVIWNLSISNNDSATQISSNVAKGTLTTLENTNSNTKLKTVANEDDNFVLNITGTNSDVVFSYKDSLGNEVTDTSETLSLSYDLAFGEKVEVRVFVVPKNDANNQTNVNLSLIKNSEEIQSFTKWMNVYGNNYCLNNGFDRLYDCILVSDSLASDVETAKVNIENKGEVNLNDTAPSYVYVEEETLDVEEVYSYTGYQFYFGDSYEFDKTKGTFRLYNADESEIITDYLSDKYKNYYTCGRSSHGYVSCATIYRIKATNVDDTKYTISLGDRITYKISASIRSEVGLYKTEDDYGDSYFYRGDVINNNILFGGYYWKIIRTNGDNSIRLIYNGETSDATKEKTAINDTDYKYTVDLPVADVANPSRHADPTYVGYMYGKNFKRQISSETTYGDIVALTQYYFADGYEFDEENEVFGLIKVESAPIAKTFSEMYGTDETTGKKLYELYPYTCRATTESGSCDVILQVNSIVNEKSAKVLYHSYSSIDEDSTRTNELSSNIKTQVELWYETNIVNKTDDNGKLITDYIVDGTFCNDRSITHATYNSGYLLNKHTYYGSYTRLFQDTDKTASLKCSVDVNGNADERDWFSYTDAKGNGLLSYPTALITADEVALAGGKYNTKNENYYLRSNVNYWTMTPSRFYSTYASAQVVNVGGLGAITDRYVITPYYVRPVINLRSDVLISSGDGTAENPFHLKLA